MFTAAALNARRNGVPAWFLFPRYYSGTLDTCAECIRAKGVHALLSRGVLPVKPLLLSAVDERSIRHRFPFDSAPRRALTSGGVHSREAAHASVVHILDSIPLRSGRGVDHQRLVVNSARDTGRVITVILGGRG
jgi:hypothetical protein